MLKVESIVLSPKLQKYIAVVPHGRDDVLVKLTPVPDTEKLKLALCPLQLLPTVMVLHTVSEQFDTVSSAIKHTVYVPAVV